MIVAATGHRPPKAGLTYAFDSAEDHDYFLKVKWRLEEHRDSIEAVVVGGALGWDTLVARAAFISFVPFKLFVPFEGQESKWPEEAQERYRKMREAAAEVVVVSDGEYAVWKMQTRNEAMVDAADELWALWDGSSGGTKNCIDYAKGKVPIFNFFDGQFLEKEKPLQLFE